MFVLGMFPLFLLKKKRCTTHHPTKNPNGNPEAEPPRESHPRNFKPPGDHFLPFRSTSVPDEKIGIMKDGGKYFVSWYRGSPHKETQVKVFRFESVPYIIVYSIAMVGPNLGNFTDLITRWEKETGWISLRNYLLRDVASNFAKSHDIWYWLLLVSWKVWGIPKGNDRLPSIHFQVRTVSSREGNKTLNPLYPMIWAIWGPAVRISKMHLKSFCQLALEGIDVYHITVYSFHNNIPFIIYELNHIVYILLILYIYKWLIYDMHISYIYTRLGESYIGQY